MCGKSIYNKLKTDFSFIENHGFYFSHYSKHYVHPEVVYIKKTVSISVGFDYEEHKFYIVLSDSTKRRYPSKEVFERIKIIDPERFKLFNEGIPECYNIMEGKVLTGDSYEDQLNQVKKFLQDYLEQFKL